MADATDPRVQIVLDAAEGLTFALEHRMREATGEDWSPSMVVAMLLAAAYQAAQSTQWTMPREQYVELVRAHADTVARGAAKSSNDQVNG